MELAAGARNPGSPGRTQVQNRRKVMFKATRTKVIGLSLVAFVALGGAIYATTAWAAGGASASAAPAQATPTTEAWPLGSSLLDMLEEHMGLSGVDAEDFADDMIAHMQKIDADLDLQEMVDWCTRYAAAGTYSRGMMNGTARGYGGWGMMGGTTPTTPTPNTGPSDQSAPSPNRPGSQDGNSDLTPGVTPGGMMNGSVYGNDSTGDGWGMMGGTTPTTPTPNTGPSDQSGDTPTPAGPPDGEFGPSSAAMMGGAMMGGAMMGTPDLR